MPKIVPSPLYLKLIRRFPLRPLRCDEELEEATKVAESLDFRDDLASDERDYLDVLIAMIERYEDEHYPIPDVSGPDALKSLIEFRGVSQAEVARVRDSGFRSFGNSAWQAPDGPQDDRGPGALLPGRTRPLHPGSRRVWEVASRRGRGRGEGMTSRPNPTYRVLPAIGPESDQCV